MPPDAGLTPLARAVIVAAATCIVVAFMRWAASIVAPILLALFITVIATPPMLWMRRKGLPKFVAVLVILLILLDAGSLIALTTTAALEAFQGGLPRYQERLMLLTNELKESGSRRFWVLAPVARNSVKNFSGSTPSALTPRVESSLKNPFPSNSWVTAAWPRAALVTAPKEHIRMSVLNMSDSILIGSTPILAH